MTVLQELPPEFKWVNNRGFNSVLLSVSIWTIIPEKLYVRKEYTVQDAINGVPIQEIVDQCYSDFLAEQEARAIFKIEQAEKERKIAAAEVEISKLLAGNK